MREAWLFCARHLGTLVPHGARLAGAAPAAAYKSLDDAVFDALTYFATTDIMGEESAVPPEPPSPPTLDTLSATELSAFKANLEGEWLELRRKRERGELVSIAAQERRFADPLMSCRSALLSMPYRLAPHFETLSRKEGWALVRAAIIEAAEHLSGDVVTASEIAAAISTASTKRRTTP
jgi:hypothetical protein